MASLLITFLFGVTVSEKEIGDKVFIVPDELYDLCDYLGQSTGVIIDKTAIGEGRRKEFQYIVETDDGEVWDNDNFVCMSEVEYRAWLLGALESYKEEYYDTLKKFREEIDNLKNKPKKIENKDQKDQFELTW